MGTLKHMMVNIVHPPGWPAALSTLVRIQKVTLMIFVVFFVVFLPPVLCVFLLNGIGTSCPCHPSFRIQICTRPRLLGQSVHFFQCKIHPFPFPPCPGYHFFSWFSSSWFLTSWKSPFWSASKMSPYSLYSALPLTRAL